MRDGMALRTQMRGSAPGWLDEGLREMRSGRFPRESHQVLKERGGVRSMGEGRAIQTEQLRGL